VLDGLSTPAAFSGYILERCPTPYASPPSNISRQHALVPPSPSFRQDHDMAKDITTSSEAAYRLKWLRSIWRRQRLQDEIDSHQLVAPLIVISFVTGVSPAGDLFVQLLNSFRLGSRRNLLRRYIQHLCRQSNGKYHHHIGRRRQTYAPGSQNRLQRYQPCGIHDILPDLRAAR
jgi:hypothetical protein